MNKTSRAILTVAAGLAALSAAGEVKTARLTVEGRDCPVGLDAQEPRFGWQITSDESDVVQTGYRIIVASNEENIRRNIGDVWDSGAVGSCHSQWIACPARLLPNKEYHWKVSAQTNKGATGWSHAARWSTGLLDQSNWRGTWIGLDSLMPWDSATRHSRLSSRYLRKEFRLKGKPKRATIHIAGLGLYTLYINGARVGDDILTPLPTDYTKTVAYNTYDITPMLANENAIGVVLAGGHYFAQTQNYQTNVRTTYSYPKLLANIIVEYADGTNETIATDGSWRLNADGALRYANEYDGEMIDTRRLFHGWDKPRYNDGEWLPADTVSPPGGTLRGNLAPAMGVYSSEKPVSIRRHGRRFIVDFGTNGAGRISMNYRAPAGDTVRIRHAELLSKGDSTLYVANLRSAEATTYYISDGKERRWQPEHTFYGFRYAEITGAENLEPSDIWRELIADRMDDSGTDITISDAAGDTTLNAIIANARRGVRSNYKGMPIDCPQRDERMPWLGDRTVGCIGESYLMNNHSLYAKWVADIRDSQRPDGSLSDVAPAYWRLYNNNITWPAALPFACDMLHRQYGDLRPMIDSYEAIKKFLSLVQKKYMKGGIITHDRYGDWCVPPESPTLVLSKDSARATDGKLIATAYYYHLCRLMSRYAPMVGHAADTALFASSAAMARKAFNDTFLSGDYSNGTATANLLPLALGLTPDESRQAVIDSLVHTIVEKNSTRVSSGVIGIQWLMRTLADIGRGDIAYEMASTRDYPGWGYMVSRGATTIWELWNGDTANPSMNSGNHVMLLGDLLPWCYERLGGISPDADSPGFKRVVLKPDFSIKRISGVKAAHNSPYGLIESEWRREGGKLKWEIRLPANTSAEVHLPNGKTINVGSGKRVFEL